MGMKPRTIRLDIGKISVEGLSPGEQARFSRELEVGLRDLANAEFGRGFAFGPREGGRWSAGSLPRDPTARQAAAQVVNRIRQGLVGQPGGNHA